MKDPTSTVEPHYTLGEAVERFFPGGHITVRSLRTEIRKGRLRVTAVAGKFLVTEAAIAEMLETCQCRVDEVHQDSTLGEGAHLASTSGTSEMERLESARVAANTTLAELKKPSRDTSPASMRRLVRFRRIGSSSTK